VKRCGRTEICKHSAAMRSQLPSENLGSTEDQPLLDVMQAMGVRTDQTSSVRMRYSPDFGMDYCRNTK